MSEAPSNPNEFYEEQFVDDNYGPNHGPRGGGRGGMDRGRGSRGTIMAENVNSVCLVILI